MLQCPSVLFRCRHLRTWLNGEALTGCVVLAGPDVSKPKECLPLNLLSHSMSVEELGFVFSSRKHPTPSPHPPPEFCQTRASSNV